MGDLSGSGSDYWWNIGSTVGHLVIPTPGVATTIAAKPEIKAREQNYGDPGDIKRETMFHMIRSGHRITGTHIAGDLAVERFMDIVEEGSKAANMTADQIRERNHVMDHCTMGPTPAQYERLKRLNITMSCAPKYIAGTARRILSDYGEQYVERVVPMKGMIESGVKTVWEIDTRPEVGHLLGLGICNESCNAWNAGTWKMGRLSCVEPGLLHSAGRRSE